MDSAQKNYSNPEKNLETSGQRSDESKQNQKLMPKGNESLAGFAKSSEEHLTGKIGELIGDKNVEAITEGLNQGGHDLANSAKRFMDKFPEGLRSFGADANRYFREHSLPVVLGGAALGIVIGMLLRPKAE